MNIQLVKDAIADAKAIRATALATAKATLEEAFAPKFNAMFADKLREENEIGSEDVNDLSKVPVAGQPTAEVPPVDPTSQAVPSEVDELISSAELEEIIQELERSVNGEEGESSEIPSAEVPPVAPAAPAPAAPCPPTAPVAPMAPVDPTTVAPSAEVPPADTDETDEEINLEELLQALNEESEKEEKEEEEDDEKSEKSDKFPFKKKVEENAKLATSGIATSDNKQPSAAAKGSASKEDGFPKVVNAEKKVTASSDNTEGKMENTPVLEENKKLKQTVKSYEDTIRFLKEQFNEINLLNAKLLYTNKLFKEFNMANEQKLKIVESFDLTKNVREVKLTYAAISEAINIGNTSRKTEQKKVITPSAVSTITEGLASKQVGSTKPSDKTVITENAVAQVNRLQKLAGIKLKPTTK